MVERSSANSVLTENRLRIQGATADEIAESIKRAIEAEALVGGDPLPTVRALALELGVNRNTVGSAYRQLSDAGIVKGRGRQGSRIALSKSTGTQGVSSIYNLAAGNPDMELLPDLQLPEFRSDWHHRGYEEAPADDQLLNLARERFINDGMPVGAIWIANGTFDAISMILRSTFSGPVKIGVEDPCFMTTLGLLRGLGHIPVPMPVDDHGILPESLNHAIDEGIQAVILTPRAHNPFGGSWSAGRQAELASILVGRDDILLIEDDHFAELSLFEARTLVSENTANWAIIRSVSKYIGPDARLAFVNSSKALGKKVDLLGVFTYRWVSGLIQKIVLHTLTSSAYATSVKRVSQVYKERRMFLINALKDNGLLGHGSDGFNVWVPVTDEQKTTRRLLEKGWIVQPGSIFRLASPMAIRVTTSALLEKEAKELAKIILEIENDESAQRGA